MQSLRMNSPINLQALSRMERDFERILRSLRTRRDLTTKQLRALCIVGKASIEGDPLATQDLCRLLGLPVQTAHNTIQRFIELGYLEQRRADDDARVKHLVLTEEGIEALRRLTETVQ